MTGYNAALGTFRAVIFSVSALCFGGTALAQEIQPSELIALLTSTCNDLENQPDAVLSDAFDNETASAARTNDGAILNINGADQTDDVYLQYNGGRNEYDGGTTIFCGASVFRPSTAIDALAVGDLLDAQAADILGGEFITSGSPVFSNGETGLMRQWATPGFPPPATLSLIASGTFLSITIVRHIPD